MIALGHSLGLQIVAEGVENEHHLKILRSQACDQVQGYLISKPLPPAAFAEFVRTYPDRSQAPAARGVAELSSVR
jgi:EAL domain-containing protein (putative c-di-GMP-specific phosphodiesterase class I)